MTQQQEAANQTPAAGKRHAGPYMMAHDDIPKELVSHVQSKLGSDAQLHPAREDGGYKGRVVLNSEQFLVQAVGPEGRNAVVHRKQDVELVGGNLQWRDENRRMGSTDIQVHYEGGSAKAYPWDRHREQQQMVMRKAEIYAKTISDAGEREVFLKHYKELNGVPEKARDDRANEPAKAQVPKSQEKSAEKAAPAASKQTPAAERSSPARAERRAPRARQAAKAAEHSGPER